MNKFYTSVQERKEENQKDTKNNDIDDCSPNTRSMIKRSTKSTEDDRIEMSTSIAKRKDYINSKCTNKVIICSKECTESIKDIAEITIKNRKVFVDQENLPKKQENHLHLQQQENQQKQQEKQQKQQENQQKEQENQPKDLENQLHPKHYLRYYILN